ncbi:MAG: dihydroorotate dehydrogenase-like protein [Bacteroidales bacterium]|nr:dihydroorotate dehydrogenase-like protein [Bacteroidales bacterium]MBR2050929.1 dihydroorotate dehydrogenase-like protein [Bacteroidales bacterium]
MKLRTTYLGLELKSPIIVSSSTLTGNVESIKKCADAGAGAVILKSIFEEQISSEIKREEGYSEEDIYDAYPEAQEYLNTFMRGSEIEIYEKLIRESKKVVDIPIIASINCSDKGEWIRIAKELQDAGADALELNIAIAAFDRDLDPRKIEEEYISILKEVEKNINIPVSVKLGDHFTNISRLAFNLTKAGAKGLVLFNRFYNPDINIEKMKVVTGNSISAPEENHNTLRWISLLSSQEIPCELSASRGVYTGEDVIKQILAGAQTVQVCSTLYRNGIEYVKQMNADIEAWMDRHNFNNVKDFRGIANKKEDIKVVERLQYLRRNYDIH